uniref:Uncharacterized protein n=1 Tax=viral metagenome TaxID=1070528 RepID=A0A6C0I5G3_9ZZZZ
MSQYKQKQRAKEDDKKIYEPYIKSLLTMKVHLSMNDIGQNIKQNLAKTISYKTEGKCIPEGFIKPGSVEVISYSSGLVNNDKIEFITVFECKVCHPVEGMLIECNTKTITKAGIHAEVSDDSENTPVTVFVARDHHFTNAQFASVKENETIVVRVVGVRFELNDPYICVIGTLQSKK